METPPERNLGTQPLDAVLDELAIENHELVESSTDQLTHKQVQKGRKGRRLTGNIHRKIAQALNATCKSKGLEKRFRPSDLFNYHD